jgi:hypothetical protein
VHALAEQLGDGIPRAARLPPRQVVRPVVRDHAEHVLRHVAQLVRQRRRSGARSRARCASIDEVRAGRQPHEDQTIGIDAEFAGVRPHVPQARADVVERGGKAVRRGEAIGDRHGRDALAREVHAVPAAWLGSPPVQPPPWTNTTPGVGPLTPSGR